jgi:hypothetical protein
MGTDINGWVEFRLADSWYAAIRPGSIVGRDYDAFGCLFGVRNFAHFRPIAPDRGIPADASLMVQHEFKEGERYWHNPTWISWREVREIDIDEPAEQADSRIHWYTRDANGALVFAGKAAWVRDFAEHVGHSIIEGVFGTRTWPEGREWEINGKIYRAERLTRGDALGGAWETLFRLMDVLADAYGADNVRLVVWFDS